MNYKSTFSEQFIATELTGFSKMEAKCAESLESLKVGDKVVVVYVTTVVENKDSALPITIPLLEPTIVKQEYFDPFSQRLLDTFVVQKVSGSAPPVEEKPQ